MRLLYILFYTLLPLSLFAQRMSKSGASQKAEVSISGMLNSLNLDQRQQFITNNYSDKKKLAELYTLLKKLDDRFGMTDSEMLQAIAKFENLIVDDAEDKNGDLFEKVAEKYRRSANPKPIILGNIFFALAQNDYYHNRSALALRRIDEAINNDKLNYYYLSYKAAILYHLGKLDEQVTVLLDCLPLCTSDPNRFTTYMKLAAVYKENLNFEQAINYSKYALGILYKQQTDVHLDISNIHSFIASIYKEQGMFERSHQYHWLAFRALTNKDTVAIAWQYNNLADLFISFGTHFDSAKYYLEACFKWANYYPNEDWTMINLTMAELYHNQMIEDRAKYYYDQAIKKSSNSTTDLALRAVNIGETCIYIAKNYLQKSTDAGTQNAVTYCLQGLREIERYPNLALSGTISNLNYLLGTAYFALRNFKSAKEYYSKCVDIYQLSSYDNDFTQEVKYKSALSSILSFDKNSGIRIIRTEKFGPLKSAKEKANSMNNIGMDFLTRGYCDVALTIFEAASEVLGDDPEYQDLTLSYLLLHNTASVYFLKGDKKTANYLFNLIHQSRGHLSQAVSDDLKAMESNVISGKVQTSCR